jgi:hypothetical protein
MGYYQDSRVGKAGREIPYPIEQPLNNKELELVTLLSFPQKYSSEVQPHLSSEAFIRIEP